MNFLEEKIIKDGIVKEGNVLKVDSFVNHQIDVPFISELGKEFHRLFKDEQKLFFILDSCYVIPMSTKSNNHIFSLPPRNI